MSGLIVKQKLSYFVTGTTIAIPFSLVGFLSEPIQYIGVLMKADAPYTLRLRDLSGSLLNEKNGTATNQTEIIVMGGELNLTCPMIVVLEAESTQLLGIYELNLATLCLCESSF